MTGLPLHKKFERQVERIHQLLEVEGSTVTWDDHIPDPDNPAQPRQIDVSIRRGGLLTLVECRIHKDPQDVTWVEELMGRRTSLKADAVIAVSASGFTKTARDKANAHGIHLRDFATLSREEIQNWGRKRTVTLNFCEFTDFTLMVRAAEPPGPGRPQLTDSEGKMPNPLTWRLLYQSIMQILDEKKWTGAPATVNAEIGANLLRVNGKAPASIAVHARVRRINHSVQLASVVVYADPITATGHAEVGKYELGTSEIIENCDNVAMTIDLSTIAVPDNCCFETVTVDMGRIVNGRPQLSAWCKRSIAVFRSKFATNFRGNDSRTWGSPRQGPDSERTYPIHPDRVLDRCAPVGPCRTTVRSLSVRDSNGEPQRSRSAPGWLGGKLR